LEETADDFVNRAFRSALPHEERPSVTFDADVDAGFDPRSRMRSDDLGYRATVLNEVSIRAPA